jgi:membrane-bound metal-dependent hydrolase YbcI (DUF457 family)
MSGYKGHIIFAFIFIVLSIILVYFAKRWDMAMLANWKLLLYIIPTIIVFSVIPDMDSEGSKPHQWAIGIAIIMAMVGYVSMYFSTKFPMLDSLSKLLPLGLVLGLFSLIVGEFKHRGFTHTITFIMLSALFLLFVHWIVFIFAVLSGISHLLLDGKMKLY